MANTSRGRFTPPAKTTRAKHTRKTTPTSPSWRFTNEPSRLVTSGGVRRHTVRVHEDITVGKRKRVLHLINQGRDHG